MPGLGVGQPGLCASRRVQDKDKETQRWMQNIDEHVRERTSEFLLMSPVGLRFGDFCNDGWDLEL